MKKILFVQFMAISAVVLLATPTLAVESVDSDETLNSFNAQLNGAHFTGDFIGTVNDGTNLNVNAFTNGVTTATNNTGSLLYIGIFPGTSTVTGIVGSSANVRLAGISAGNANTTTTFNGNVFSTTSTVRSTGTIAYNGNFNGVTVNFDGNGNVRLGDGKTLTAAVTTDTDNTGSLSFIGDGFMAGQVGTSSAKVTSVTGGAVGKQVVFSNDVFATNTYVTHNGTLTFNGDVTTALNFGADGLVQFAGGSDLTGAITTLTNNTGSVTYSGSSSITSAIGSVAGNDLKAVTMEGGIVTLNSGADYAVTTTTVRTNTSAGVSGTMAIGQNSTVTGTVFVNGTGKFDASQYALTVTGDFEISGGTTLKTTVTTSSGTSTTAGRVIASTAADDARVSAASTLDVNVQASYVSNGTVYMLVDGHQAGALVAAPTTVTDNSTALTFTPTVQNNDLVMTVTRANLGTVTTDSNSRTIGTALNGFSSGATGDMANVIANIDTLTSSQQITDAFNQLDPDANGGANQASFNATGGALNTVSNRLDNARGGMIAGNGQNGLSSGDMFTDAAIWAQGFGAYGDQDGKDGVAGYTASTWGTAIGLDSKTDERTRLGVSFAFSQSDVDTEGETSTVEIDGYQGSLYASYEGDPWYLDAMFAFGWNQYDASRNIVFASINRTAEAGYDGQTYSTKFTFGYPLALAEHWSLVPLASLFYSHLNLDGYTETGASSLNLIVEDQSYDFLQQGLGAKIVTEFTDASKQKWVPQLHALWLYDYIGDEAASTSTFTAGGTSFDTAGLKPEQSSLNAGTGLTIYPNDSLSLSVNYDFEYRSDYTGHTGSATVRYEF